jgi:hypothetical protein
MRVRKRRLVEMNAKKMDEKETPSISIICLTLSNDRRLLLKIYSRGTPSQKVEIFS